MAMTRCERGHYYSPEQHSHCPYCGIDLDMGPTEIAPGMADPLPMGGRGDVEPGNETKGVMDELGIDPTVGWLVCVKGKDRGRDYRIRDRRNYIGRSPRMDICVEKDEQISREKHAIIGYDSRRRRFTLMPGESHKQTYLNENVVNTPTDLKARDLIELGDTTLMFIPLCGEDFTWQKETSSGGGS